MVKAVLSNGKVLKVIEVMINIEPPIGTWAYMRKGSVHSVIDCGEYYKLANDVNKETGARCLPKDFVVIISNHSNNDNN